MAPAREKVIRPRSALMLLRQPSHASVDAPYSTMKTRRSLPTYCLAEDGELPDLGLPVVVSIEEAFTMRFRLRQSCRNEHP